MSSVVIFGTREFSGSLIQAQISEIQNCGCNMPDGNVKIDIIL